MLNIVLGLLGNADLTALFDTGPAVPIKVRPLLKVLFTLFTGPGAGIGPRQPNPQHNLFLGAVALTALGAEGVWGLDSTGMTIHIHSIAL